MGEGIQDRRILIGVNCPQADVLPNQRLRSGGLTIERLYEGRAGNVPIAWLFVHGESLKISVIVMLHTRSKRSQSHFKFPAGTNPRAKQYGRRAAQRGDPR